MIKRLGYACINETLAAKKITTGRKMIKATFKERGLDYASQLALLNVTDLKTIMEWNVANGIKMYRMSSSMFPWCSEYEFKDLPHYNQIKSVLKQTGDIANQNDIRVSFHPGHFTILSSAKSYVTNIAIKDLNQHAEIMDLMGLPKSHHSKINIHIGGAKSGKVETMDRFCTAFKKLKPSTKARLTIENDDRPSMYTVSDLMYVYNKIGTPIVFDYHHHDCHPGELTKQESFELAMTTWPQDIIPAVHYSSSRRNYEDPTCKVVAHADYIYDEIPDYGFDIDVMCESKAKELAILEYIETYKEALIWN
jgi:UV DNA damage endonuclease